MSVLTGRLGAAFRAVPTGGEEEKRALLARALFAMFSLGAALALVAIPLSSYLTPEDIIAVFAAVGVAIGVAALIVLSWRRLPMIAEFVGDAHTLDLLRRYGGPYAQGYHIGRTQPVSEMWADVRARLPAREVVAS